MPNLLSLPLSTVIMFNFSRKMFNRCQKIALISWKHSAMALLMSNCFQKIQQSYPVRHTPFYPVIAFSWSLKVNYRNILVFITFVITQKLLYHLVPKMLLLSKKLSPKIFWTLKNYGQSTTKCHVYLYKRKTTQMYFLNKCIF